MMLPRRILAVAYCHTALADIGLNLREVETAGLPFEGLTDATMLEENSDRGKLHRHPTGGTQHSRLGS